MYLESNTVSQSGEYDSKDTKATYNSSNYELLFHRDFFSKYLLSPSIVVGMPNS